MLLYVCVHELNNSLSSSLKINTNPINLPHLEMIKDENKLFQTTVPFIENPAIVTQFHMLKSNQKPAPAQEQHSQRAAVRSTVKMFQPQ